MVDFHCKLKWKVERNGEKMQDEIFPGKVLLVVNRLTFKRGTEEIYWRPFKNIFSSHLKSIEKIFFPILSTFKKYSFKYPGLGASLKIFSKKCPAFP